MGLPRCSPIVRYPEFGYIPIPIGFPCFGARRIWDIVSTMFQGRRAIGGHFFPGWGSKGGVRCHCVYFTAEIDSNVLLQLVSSLSLLGSIRYCTRVTSGMVTQIN